jgi:tRNA/tmRNA/rRNA uracil-C5-methylase (TrmA/RlmC/RlmD family)
VYGFEIGAEAVRDARANAAANGLDGRATFYAGDLARILKDYAHLPYILKKFFLFL